MCSSEAHWCVFNIFFIIITLIPEHGILLVMHTLCVHVDYRLNDIKSLQYILNVLLVHYVMFNCSSVFDSSRN